jgi:hypothetical protein
MTTKTMVTTILTILLAFVCFGTASLSARQTRPTDVTFPDGAVGSVTAECGLGDLCATLTLSNKDTIEVYNEGAGYCQAFTLNIIRMRGDTILLTTQSQTASKRVKEGPQHFLCDQFVSTYLTLDAGIAQLGLFLSHDGTLFGEWSVQHSDTSS